MRNSVLLTLVALIPAAGACAHVRETPVDAYYVDGSAAAPGDSVSFEFVPRARVSQVTAVEFAAPELGLERREIFRTDELRQWYALRTDAKPNPDHRAVTVQIPGETTFRGTANLEFTVSYRRAVPLGEIEFDIETADAVLTMPLTVVDKGVTAWRVQRTALVFAFSFPYILGILVIVGFAYSRPSLSGSALGWITLIMLLTSITVGMIKFSVPVQAVWGSQSGWVTAALAAVWIALLFGVGAVLTRLPVGRQEAAQPIQ